MTINEKNLLIDVKMLYRDLPEDDISDTAIDDFNERLTGLLEEYDISLEDYHDLLIQEVEEAVENGD